MADTLRTEGPGSDGTAYSVDELSDMLQAFEADAPKPEKAPGQTTPTGRPARVARQPVRIPAKPTLTAEQAVPNKSPIKIVSGESHCDIPDTEVAQAIAAKRQAVLRSKVANAQNLLAEEIRQREEVKATSGEDRKSASNGLPTRFEITWEKTLRRARTNTELLCGKILALGETADARAISILKPFAHSKAKAVRLAAAKAIREVETPEATFVLLSLLKDRKSKIARAAFIGVVSRLDSILVEPLLAYGSLDASTKAIAARHFAEIDKTQAQVLIEFARSDDDDLGLFALQMYGKVCDSDSVSDLASFTKHESPEFRAAAIDALIGTRNQQVVRFLNKALKDPDEHVRSRAAAGLSNWSSENSAKQLLTLLKDPSIEVRRNAATALAKAPKKEFLSTILEVLEDESDESIQLSLIQAVGQIGSPKSADVLYGLSRTERTDVRISALAALTKVNDKRAMPTLIRMLDDPDEKIREKATAGIGFKGNVAGIPKLVEVRKSDQAESVRIAATRALGNIASNKCIPGLKNALHDEAKVRCQAIIGLRRIGGEKAISVLMDRLNDMAPEVRYNVVSALGELKAKESIPALRKMVEDPNDMVQRAVHKVLGEFGVSVSSDLWKRRVQRVSGGVKDSLPILKIAVPVFLAAFVFVGSGLYLFAGESLGWKSGPPIPIRDTLQAAISPNGRTVIVIRQGGVVDHWDVETGKLVTRIAPKEKPVGAIFDIDSASILLLGNGKGLRWDLDSEAKLVPDDAQFGRLQVGYAASMNQMAVVSKSISSNYFVSWNKNREPQTLLVPAGFESAMAISPDGQSIAVVNDKSDIQLLSTENSNQIASYALAFEGPVKLSVTSLAFSPDGTKLAYSVNSGEVSAMDLEAGTVETFVTEGAVVSDLVWTNDSLVAITNDEVRLQPTDGTAEMESIEGLPIEPDHFSISADGSRLLVASRDSKTVAVVDLKARKILHTFKPSMPQ
jgi:HEAT repeat protein/DNA-binding beta-propeller fold protein YncE